MPQMNEDNDDYVFQQDGCPAHFHNDVRDYLNTDWIGIFGQEDVALMRWSPRTTDLTPCDFSLWGFVKDNFFTPVSAYPQELRNRYHRSCVIDRDMLTHECKELDYRLDVCLISQCGHIEHSWYMKNKLVQFLVLLT